MITYRANRVGTVLAAYRGECRVGYVTRSDVTWGWELKLMHPSGGHYYGTAGTEDKARAALENAFREWMVHARLQEKTS
jgi:hypothetical protein